MEVAVLDRPGVDGKRDGVEGPCDVHLAGPEDGSVDGALLPGGNGEDLHPVELDVGVQPHVLESAEQEASGNGSLAVRIVLQGNVVKMETLRIHRDGTADVVGNLGEINAQDAVHNPHVLAGDVQFVQFSPDLDLAFQAAAELVEDAGEDGGGVAHVQPVQGHVGTDGFVGGLQEAVQVDVALPVQEIAETFLDAGGGIDEDEIRLF